MNIPVVNEYQGSKGDNEYTNTNTIILKNIILKHVYVYARRQTPKTHR